MSGGLFDTCCCCIDLHTGCLIYGYLNLILNIITTIPPGISLLAVISLGFDQNEFVQQFGNYVVIPVGIIFLIFLLFLIFAIVLLVGLHQNRPGHVKAFIVFEIVFLVLLSIAVIGLFVAIGSYMKVSWIVGIIAFFLLKVYFLLVVSSQHSRMSDSAPACVYNSPLISA